VATLQAVEVVKELARFGESLSGWLVLYDAAATRLERLRIRRRPPALAAASTWVRLPRPRRREREGSDCPAGHFR
jgi:hypothetical protein